MKLVAVVLCLFLSVCSSQGQEQIPPETAVKAAKLVVGEAAKLEGLPLRTDVDAEKPYGIKKDDRAALIIPDKKLTEEALSKPTKSVQPVAQLWIKGLTPYVKGAVTSNDKLLLTKIQVGDTEHEVVLLLLGVQENNGKAEVVVHSKDKEPLMVVPVDSVSQKQEQPIELDAKHTEGEAYGQLLITIFGKYQAKLPLSPR